MFGRRRIRSWEARPEIMFSMILTVSIAVCRTGAQCGIPRVVIPVLDSQLTGNIIGGVVVDSLLTLGAIMWPKAGVIGKMVKMQSGTPRQAAAFG
jgi:hypothetical protein